MHYLQSRYYDPEIRRFISADSIVIKSLAGTNLYEYCGNNPVNMRDPSGKFAVFSRIVHFVSRIHNSVRQVVYCLNASGGDNSCGSPVDISERLDNALQEHYMELLLHRKKYGLISSLDYFIQKVRTKREWDLKNSWHLRKDAVYIYHGKEFNSADLGNLHFGYVGSTILNLNQLLSGAGAYQLYSDYLNSGHANYSDLSLYDDPLDQEMVAYGYQLACDDHPITPVLRNIITFSEVLDVIF